MKNLIKILFSFSLLISLSYGNVKKIIEPDIQTKGPLIYLADNLGEEKKLGWCIDTKGKGFHETLHSHSCKPEGADTQFRYDALSKNIISVTFKGKCMTLNEADNITTPFALLDCKSKNPKQQFSYDKLNQEFEIIYKPDHCVAVGQEINNAGPYQSRDLILAPCNTLEDSLKKWVVRN